jgi:crossover junction endodeoxyribonuclease RuvC
MKILGIDPGYERVGVSVIEVLENKTTLIYSACIQTDKKLPLPERFFTIGECIEKIITDYSPSLLAIEDLFFTSNQKTVMGVAGVRGMIIYISKKAGLRVCQYTPLQIKIALTGYGRADKTQVAFMVERLISLPAEKRLDDEIDAIACALTASADKSLY